MATFTADADLNLRFHGYEIVGAAGATHRIDDALVEEFEAGPGRGIPGFAWVDQDEITTAASGIHSHAESAITGLTDDLAGKAALVHTHAQSAVTDLTTDLAGKAALVHSHAQSSITNLNTALVVSATTATTARFKGEPWYDVKAYGAVADGSTDDRTALLSVLNLSGPKTVVLPKGNYSIQGAVTVSVAGTRILGNAATITQASNSTTIFVVTADDVAIEGITFAQTGTAGGTSETDYGSAAVFKLCRNGLIRDCRISNAGVSATAVGAALTGAAIWLSGATNCAVEGNVIERGAMGVNTDAFYGKSGGNRIVGNTFTATSRAYVLELQGAQTSASLGDVFRDNMLFATIDKAIVVDATQNGFEISGNRIIGAGSQGITVLGTVAEGRILSNFISGTDTGITLNHTGGVSIERMVIADNVLIDNTNEGLSFYSLKDTVISGNRIDGNGRIGLHSPAGFPERLTITGNVVRDSGQDGIYLIDPRDIIISGNFVISNSSATSAAFDGIRIGKDAIDARNVLVEGNIVGASDTANHPQRHRYAFNNQVAAQSGVRLLANIFTNGYVSAAVADSAGNIERFGNVPSEVSDVITHRGSRREGGTSFPTGPVEDDIFYRTDRAIEYYYDGTRWLSTTLYRETFSPADGAPGLTSGSVIGRMAPWHTTYDLYIEKFQTTLMVLTTNTSAAYWTVALRKADVDDSATTIVTVATSASSPSQWVTADTTVGALLTPATYKQIDAFANKVGSPGALYFAIALTYRLVG